MSLRPFILLASGCVAILLFFPPWVYTYDRNGTYGAHSKRPAGHIFAFTPPVPDGISEFDGVRIDGPRLISETAALLCAAAFIAAVLSAAQKRKKQ